jgi:hypothetical protein
MLFFPFSGDQYRGSTWMVVMQQPSPGCQRGEEEVEVAAREGEEETPRGAMPRPSVERKSHVGTATELRFYDFYRASL